MTKERNLKINCKHIDKECFNSVETKGKSCQICKNCGMYLGTIHPLDNASKCEPETKEEWLTEQLKEARIAGTEEKRNGKNN